MERKNITRRQFLQAGGVVGAAAVVPTAVWRSLASGGKPGGQYLGPQTLLPANQIPQFVTPLRTFTGERVDTANYTVSIEEFQQFVLPPSFYESLKPPFKKGTFLFGHRNAEFPPTWPGHTVIAHRNTPTIVTYVNNLPFPGHSQLEPLLTMDETLNWANPENLPPSNTPYEGVIPTVTHLHGNEVPSDFDGTSEQWFTQNGIRGPGYKTFVPTAPNAAVYEYVNTQQPNGMMFHPHERGITRTQVYAGLVSHYWLRDQFDTGLSNNPLGLPADPFEIELTLQDREFDTNGQLFYPNGGGGDPNVHPFWLDSFFASVICVNGTPWPFFEVQPRRYRFRILNFANMRWFQMWLQNATTGAAGPPIWQIGTDGGLLDVPVMLSANPADNNVIGGTKLLLGTTERSDVIIDFTEFAGQTLNLLNAAPSPLAVLATSDEEVFPDPTLDANIMQFRVAEQISGPPDNTFNPATPGATLRGGTNQPPAIVRLVDPTTGTVAPGVNIDLTRQLTFLEFDAGPGNDPNGMFGGPFTVEYLINNTTMMGNRQGTNQIVNDTQEDQSGQGFFMTELPRVGSTEQWEIMVMTDETHPIHIHLIQFQVLNRQQAGDQGDVAGYHAGAYAAAFPGGTYFGLTSATSETGTPTLVDYPPGVVIPGYGPPNDYLTPNADGAIGGNPAFSPFLTGPIIPPEPYELGWKDVWHALDQHVNRIVVRWAPVDVAIGDVVAGQNAFAFDPTVGSGYMWHCHMFEHEDNELMHAFILNP